MKVSLSFLFLLIAGQLAAQTQFQLQGRVQPCDFDTVRLFYLDGVSLREAAKAPIQRDEQGAYFAMGFAFIPPGFYFVGNGNPSQTKQVILGIDSLVFLQGSSAQFDQAAVVQSRANQAFSQALTISNQLQQQSNQINRQYQMLKQQKQPTEAVETQLRQLDAQKLALLDSAQLVHPLLRQALALRTYLVGPDKQQPYPSELDFFAATYFSQANLQDTVYRFMPLLNEAFHTYAQTLGSVSLAKEAVLAFCDRHLKPLPQPGPTHKAAILGLASGFRDNNNDAFAHYANQYLQLYGPQDNPAFAAQLQQEVFARQALLVGSVAPDLRLPSPEGDSISISDFRGQVLLLDFWASWCRPCRVENPRVKAMYDKYHGQGFEILAFSLDRSKDAWVGAIQQDGLPWVHVSDLAMWSSTASRQFQVSAIPYTVLLDREGRIVAKGLRGPALEAQVAALLNEAEE